jgi:RNA polymerase sigma factor (sigma-70 family)
MSRMSGIGRLTPTADDELLSSLVQQVLTGDSAALDELVRHLATPMYNLALRMLWHPEDAEDAVQEILIKVVTGLGSFRGESAVTTWTYRIAVNHLLTTRKRRFESMGLSFEAHAEDLAAGLDTPVPAGLAVEDAVLENEVKAGCTHAMLLCLDRDARMAFILGDVFDLPAAEAAALCAVSAATFRKRLSRARAAIRDHMAHYCGLVNDAAACRCNRRVGAAIELGRIAPGRLNFAGPEVDVVSRGVEEMEQLNAASAVFHGTPSYRAPERLAAGVSHLLGSRNWSLLDSAPDRGERGNQS